MPDMVADAIMLCVNTCLMYTSGLSSRLSVTVKFRVRIVTTSTDSQAFSGFDLCSTGHRER
jgi:hypothetical protein